jgi:PST family polysaccharide transporter
MLAASARDAALRLTRQMVVLMGVLGFVLSIGLAVIAPWACPILLGSNFLPSVTITQILSPLPFFVAVSNVLGIQVMIPFKHDRAFTSILVGAGVFNVALGVLLAPRWQGNGMALSATLSEFLVTAAMLFHMTRHGLAPWSKAQPEAANV